MREVAPGAAEVSVAITYLGRQEPPPIPLSLVEPILSDEGIKIVGRMPVHAPVNPDNRRYLTAKAARAGHQLDQLLAALHPSVDERPANGSRGTTPALTGGVESQA